MEPTVLDELTSEDRLRLVRFVAAMAWADLEVLDSEKNFVHRLVDSLGLDEAERAKADSYLRTPPRPEEIDPQDVPEAHIELFLLSVKAAAATDGKLSRGELETLALLEQLLTGDDRTEEWGGVMPDDEGAGLA